MALFGITKNGLKVNGFNNFKGLIEAKDKLAAVQAVARMLTNDEYTDVEIDGDSIFFFASYVNEKPSKAVEPVQPKRDGDGKRWGCQYVTIEPVEFFMFEPRYLSFS
jgi:hypothetical protein